MKERCNLNCTHRRYFLKRPVSQKHSKSPPKMTETSAVLMPGLLLELSGFAIETREEDQEYIDRPKIVQS